MRLGHAGGRCPSGATPERRQLAAVLLSLCRCTKSRTQAERAAQIWVSTPALSLYVNARRIPSIAILRLLYQLAEEGGRAQLPCTWAELVQLRELAKSSPHSSSREFHADQSTWHHDQHQEKVSS